ncbi:DUF6879 family protein [Streptomyces radiopugnans]|uniref:DUF6879 domain-containing protein n=1 Tax=Streptomyces radiopugnans TaxID=403935 RepID=A0A1H9B9U6_9ACTN|nr:DUF6879 family protein [Streptomyces radiopugnans]SEP84998.1 hypothetical protein SAMN05216481_102233 [Streptomyces radiopugnans]
MFESFPAGESVRLDRKRYHEDFYRVFESGIRELRKLERGQHFRERGFPSWEAFDSGEWEKALSLVEEKREAYTRQLREAEHLGVRQRRLRVVEFPVTPYVQWEFFVLRLKVELGDEIRAIDAHAIAEIERERPVPEVVILGDRAMYEVVYENGDAAGARRYADPALIAETAAGFDTLYERGEDFAEFFEREIAPLPPPSVGGRAPVGHGASRT